MKCPLGQTQRLESLCIASDTVRSHLFVRAQLHFFLTAVVATGAHRRILTPLAQDLLVVKNTERRERRRSSLVVVILVIGHDDPGAEGGPGRSVVQHALGKAPVDFLEVAAVNQAPEDPAERGYEVLLSDFPDHRILVVFRAAASSRHCSGDDSSQVRREGSICVFPDAAVQNQCIRRVILVQFGVEELVDRFMNALSSKSTPANSRDAAFFRISVAILRMVGVAVPFLFFSAIFFWQRLLLWLEDITIRQVILHTWQSDGSLDSVRPGGGGGIFQNFFVRIIFGGMAGTARPPYRASVILLLLHFQEHHHFIFCGGIFFPCVSFFIPAIFTRSV
mmetsp:Transcript_31882/g.58419  ORF Transcript_31882/g.58419 Transcript_31882/m.58419 type:complete len:335 (-) Transcript_31882:2699-3703(-)